MNFPDTLTDKSVQELEIEKHKLEGLIRGPDQKIGHENCLRMDKMLLEDVCKELKSRKEQNEI